LAQSRIPRISTRGYYDRKSGKTLKKKHYDLYPKKFFDNLGQSAEFTIMIHGMRNSRSAAVSKFQIAKKRLRQLGYVHQVVGFSYDSDVSGAHLKSSEALAVRTAKLVARKNGSNLSQFIVDFKKKYPKTKIRLMGHSLGSEVIIHTLLHLARKRCVIEGAYFFGSSVPADLLTGEACRRAFAATVRTRLVNHYSANDDVLKSSYARGILHEPVGYLGLRKKIPKYVQKHVLPRNHRFVSYAAVLERYP